MPARIGGIQNAQGPNIYQTSTVNRQIYEIRAVVESGNSGGPLLSPAGTVYGVVFAAAVGVSNTGFALTAAQVSDDARPASSPPPPSPPWAATDPPQAAPARDLRGAVPAYSPGRSTRCLPRQPPRCDIVVALTTAM